MLCRESKRQNVEFCRDSLSSFIVISIKHSLTLALATLLCGKHNKTLANVLARETLIHTSKIVVFEAAERSIVVTVDKADGLTVPHTACIIDNGNYCVVHVVRPLSRLLISFFTLLKHTARINTSINARRRDFP